MSEPAESFRRYDALPMARAGRVNWEEVATEARNYPGEWVESPVSVNPSVAAQMRDGKYSAISPDEFDISTRKDPERPKASYVYIRTRR